MSVSIKNSVSGGGGGITSDEVTAIASDVLKGKTYVGNDTNDEIGTGTLELTGNAGVGDVLSGSTFYNTNAKSKQTGTLALSGNAGVGDVLSGSTFYNTNAKSKQTGTLVLSGNAAVGDVLKNATFYNTNAKSKQTGTLELTGNAYVGDVLDGLTFYNNDAKTKRTGIAKILQRSGGRYAVSNQKAEFFGYMDLIVTKGNLTIHSVYNVIELEKNLDSNYVNYVIYKTKGNGAYAYITTTGPYSIFEIGYTH